MPRGLHTRTREMFHITINFLNHKYININFVKLYTYNGQKVPCGTYMVPRRPGQVAHAGLTWFPVSRAKVPRGLPSYFTIIFHQFLFTIRTLHTYHVEAHLSGYNVLDLWTPTSIITGVGVGKVGRIRVRCCSNGIWTETACLNRRWQGSRLG